jgi:hypothetical protein
MGSEMECREYQGLRDPQGYGRRQVRRFSSQLVHRQVWEMAYGPIPEGMCVLHKCDNPPCFLIDHLFLGTRGDNNQDSASKGRSRNALTGVTECKRGHSFDDENAYVAPDGSRSCRTCERDKHRRRRGSALSN